MTNGIYVHFPFCKNKCRYCAFYSVAADDIPAYASRYTAALKQEITGREALRGAEVNSVYFGGGSPSLFPAKNTGEVLSTLLETFKVSPAAEISIEINPSDASREKLSALKKAGFNRFTLGVQTLSPQLHKLIGRSGEPCGKKHLDEFFALGGVTHCIDLIVGIPGQSRTELEEELNTIASYGAEHISAYLLSVEEGTPLAADILRDEEFEESQRLAFMATKSALEGLGYRHYEISNYALAGRESAHNLKYWRFEPYISFGSGAHSFYSGKRYINRASIEEYIAAPAAPPQEDIRNASSAMAEFIMTGLRLLEGFSLFDFAARFGGLPAGVRERIEAEVKKGLLEAQASRVLLSKKGLLLADAVTFNIVSPLL